MKATQANTEVPELEHLSRSLDPHNDRVHDNGR
jgi:hypothetical protein